MQLITLNLILINTEPRCRMHWNILLGNIQCMSISHHVLKELQRRYILFYMVTPPQDLPKSCVMVFTVQDAYVPIPKFTAIFKVISDCLMLQHTVKTLYISTFAKLKSISISGGSQIWGGFSTKLFFGKKSSKSEKKWEKVIKKWEKVQKKCRKTLVL